MCNFWGGRRHSQWQRKTSHFGFTLTDEKSAGILSRKNFERNFSWKATLKPRRSLQVILFCQTQSVVSKRQNWWHCIWSVRWRGRFAAKVFLVVKLTKVCLVIIGDCIVVARVEICRLFRRMNGRRCRDDVRVRLRWWTFEGGERNVDGW